MKASADTWAPVISPRMPAPATCYQALLARDARYDDLFFICVKTTGTFCCPNCHAILPK